MYNLHPSQDQSKMDCRPKFKSKVDYNTGENIDDFGYIVTIA